MREDPWRVLLFYAQGYTDEIVAIVLIEANGNSGVCLSSIWIGQCMFVLQIRMENGRKGRMYIERWGNIGSILGQGGAGDF